MFKRVRQILFQLVMLGAILFISSGQLDWVMAWVYLGTFLLGVIINGVILFRVNPSVIAERAEPGAGVKGWDRWISIIGAVTGLSALVVSGLDRRFGWSAALPLGLQIAALALLLLGSFFSSWAMIVNAFFSTAVRIQEERGHAVVSRGPYRLVRHPGYSGWIVGNAMVPLVLGSLWALIPGLVAALLLAVRTALEDRTLQNELDGYREYAQRVRFRLFPGIW
jgi:protein-S-isoprenylcysteine O-methyltransferase Ste14